MFRKCRQQVPLKKIIGLNTEDCLIIDNTTFDLRIPPALRADFPLHTSLKVKPYAPYPPPTTPTQSLGRRYQDSSREMTGLPLSKIPTNIEKLSSNGQSTLPCTAGHLCIAQINLSFCLNTDFKVSFPSISDSISLDGDQKFALLTISQVTLMLLVQGPHFENYYNRIRPSKS